MNQKHQHKESELDFDYIMAQLIRLEQEVKYLRDLLTSHPVLGERLTRKIDVLTVPDDDLDNIFAGTIG